LAAATMVSNNAGRVRLCTGKNLVPHQGRLAS
jgi:hypothetical protein